MANNRPSLSNSLRGVSPCKDCTERFIACQDRCPRDARGEYGYKAWKDEIKRVNQERQKYLERTLGRRYIHYGGGKTHE